jgi:DNA-binding transcriptional LysR family regulator
MLDWNDLRYFLAVHREGTLARAATALGINATTVGRRLTALEEHIKTRLFDRTPDGYVLTPSGRDLVDRAERMEEEALALERLLTGADQRPSGSVRVTATEMLVTRFVTPYLPQFYARYPEITLDVECTNRIVSLSRRETDIALRLTRPREDDVVTRRLGRVPLGLYASLRYLEEHGTPPHPDTSLDGHRVLLFADALPFAVENDWLLARLGTARIVFRSDSVSSIYAAAASGSGIALLPAMVADRDPSLRRIETTSSPEPRVIWQAIHIDVQKSARIRAVLEFLGEILIPAAEP